MFSAPKGVPDYVPPVSSAFLSIRETLAAPARAAGYGYIELPVFEELGLFVRGVGESTDVVSKEMYTFTDRGGREMGLRPEGTAGVMRAVIEHGLDRGQLPVKLWYAGPFFRAERPQAGRYRQLQQVGVEAIGSDDPALDAEVIALADEAFRRVGLTGFTLHLTSLGCRNCRPEYRRALQEFLAGLDLDDATRERAAINPLRVLDDKRESVQRQLAAAPLMPQFWCQSCTEHYTQVRQYLAALQVAWSEAPRLVRGLDYYTRTTFEFSHPGLGAQSGIGGGGRYDGLMASLGGQELTGIGWGIGTDRTLLASQAEHLAVGPGNRCDVYLVALGEPARSYASALGKRLREAGVRSDMAFGGRGLKGAMKGADRSGAKCAIIVGDAELAAGTVVVKVLSTGQQGQVSDQDLLEHVQRVIEQEEQQS